MTEPACLVRIAPSCAVIVLGAMALWAATDGFRALTEESARRLRILEHRPVLPAIGLEDMRGDRLNIGAKPDSVGKFTLVEFIYTTCPTICQSAAGSYATIRNRIVASGLANRVRMLSISFDPERDNPPQLRRYADIHDADGKTWTITRIRPADLDLARRAFGLRIIPDNWGGYQHNAAIHVIDRSARLAGIFDIDDVNGVLGFVSERAR